MELIVAGRKEIERGIVVRSAYIVISISDPRTKRPRIRKTAGLKEVLYLKFHDAEPLRGGKLPDGMVLMAESHARKIWEFVLRHYQDIGTIVVHCEQGVSRSPAVAVGIAEVLGLDAAHILAESQPNRFVIDLIRSAGHAVLSRPKDVRIGSHAN